MYGQAELPSGRETVLRSDYFPRLDFSDPETLLQQHEVLGRIYRKGADARVLCFPGGGGTGFVRYLKAAQILQAYGVDFDLIIGASAGVPAGIALANSKNARAFVPLIENVRAFRGVQPWFETLTSMNNQPWHGLRRLEPLVAFSQRQLHDLASYQSDNPVRSVPMIAMASEVTLWDYRDKLFGQMRKRNIAKVWEYLREIAARERNFFAKPFGWLIHPEHGLDSQNIPILAEYIAAASAVPFITPPFIDQRGRRIGDLMWNRPHDNPASFAKLLFPDALVATLAAVPPNELAGEIYVEARQNGTEFKRSELLTFNAFADLNAGMIAAYELVGRYHQQLRFRRV